MKNATLPCFPPHAIYGSPTVFAWMRTTPATGVSEDRQSSTQLQRHPAPPTGPLEAIFATYQTSSPLLHHLTLH